MPEDRVPLEEPDIDDNVEDGDAPRPRLLSRLAHRLRNPGELGEDALELLGTVVESSDRAKTEMVRMVAREVRTYLEELKLKDDVRELITGHSLEMHLSLSLKPLAGADKEGGGEPAAETDDDEVEETESEG